ncbi:MAG: hypothetical protein WC677_00610 [Clostridia bacterium]|jgi:hypothetical protein
MHTQAEIKPAAKSKFVSIMILFMTSVAITMLGASLTVYSIICGVSFTVLNNSVPGAVFGVVILFLGIRYFLAVRKLKIEVYKTSSKFSWSNFKREKKK